VIEKVLAHPGLDPQPLRLTSAETRDLLALLHSLTAPDATRWPAGPWPGCRPSRVVGDLDIR